MLSLDIILEGFLEAEKIHRVRYMTLVWDGDSKVLDTLYKNVPEWGPYIKKVECANHSCKNIRAKLELLVTGKPQYKGGGKLTRRTICRLSGGVRCAIKMRSVEENRKEAIRKLEHDILNCVYHTFGHDKKCSLDFC